MDDFRIKLEFKPLDLIMTKEESILLKIMKVFAKEEIKLQHSVLNYYIDLYFPEHRLAVEIDEKGHLDRNKNKEKERENNIKEAIGREFVRINPDREKFDVEICRIYDMMKLKKEKQFFFLYWFSFTNIHESQDCRGRGRAFH